MAEATTFQVETRGDHEQMSRETRARINDGIVCARRKRYEWWLRIGVYTFFVLSGQSAATLLGRQYYDKGGNSKWLATLVQLAGFPILIPFYLFSPLRTANGVERNGSRRRRPFVLGSIYVVFGLVGAADCFLYSIGLLYLPVSTYSLICASQLAFNAVFSFFINSQKFTPYIVNSLVLLTTSSALLVSQTDSSTPDGITRQKYIIGFACTVGASAGYALILSLTQLFFKKVVMKRESFRAVMDLIIFQSLVATSVILVGLFASGEYKDLKGEMEGYKLGKVSYMMNLIWTCVCWDVFIIGAVGIIFEVSSLFSNAISVLGLPIVPVLAVVFFGDKMDGTKVVSMLLAIWGFISYVYQQYLDDHEAKAEAKVDEEALQ